MDSQNHIYRYVLFFKLGNTETHTQNKIKITYAINTFKIKKF